ncbi:MAG: hypothetical protein KF780_09540 [Sphingomonas sp.]|nr:hypothetical protein [Sphingomonas sp.]
MKLPIAAFALIGTAACVTTDDAAAPEPSYRCNADAVQNLVGREPSSEVGADALARSNSRSLRWIRPGDAVTMDYREDRLNIHIDARGRIERITCG